MSTEKKPLGDKKFEMTRFDFSYDNHVGLLRKLPSQHYPFTKDQQENITNLFSIPLPNSVGTHQMDDQIKTIQFNGNKLDFDKIDSLSAGGQYAFTQHPISKRYAGFAQTRAFNLIDFDANRVREFCDGICRSLSEEIKEVWTIDPDKPVMMFWSFERGGYAQDKKYNQRHTLRTYDFSGSTEKLLDEIILEPTDDQGFNEFPYFYNDTLFILRHDELRALDRQFKPVEHPAVSLFNQFKAKHGYFDLSIIITHPEYPFAWIDEDRSKDRTYEANWIAYWGEQAEQKFHFLLPGKPTAVPRLSPDGEWLIYSSKMEKQLLYFAMPVVDDPPFHLGRPVLLGMDYSAGVGKHAIDAFTTRPLAFVVLGPNGIDRYELPPAPKTREEIDSWNDDPQPYIDAWLTKQGRNPTGKSPAGSAEPKNSGGSAPGGVWDKFKSWLF